MRHLYLERDLTLDSLRGETVSFTGDLTYMTREEAMTRVKAAGGKSPPQGRLTRQTTVLVYGKANVGSKIDRARKDPTIEVISSDQFIGLLGLKGTVRTGEKISSRRETREWTKPANYDRPGRRTELDVIAGQGGVDRERRALNEGETRPSLSPARRKPAGKAPTAKPKRTRTPRKPAAKPDAKPATTTPAVRTERKPATSNNIDTKVKNKYFK